MRKSSKQKKIDDTHNFRYDQRMKEKGKRSEAVQELKSSVDPQLHQEAEKLGRLITRFEVISKKLLQKYNKV